MSGRDVEPLGPERFEDAWRLSRLAFGGDPDAAPPPPPDEPPRGDAWGVIDDRGRLLGKVVLLEYEQWWGGQPVPMGGVAGVAVHPDGRGRGVARRLVEHVSVVMRERGQPVSVLFPTVVPLYRSLGWEAVGALDDTRLATRDLAPQLPAAGCTVRSGEADHDADAVQALYDEWARTTPGALTRRGRPFPGGAAEAFESDVVAIAQGPDGRARGYVTYDRGRGYLGAEGELRVWELVSADAEAARALLGSLARWANVAATTLWRGRTELLRLLTAAPVPAPVARLPWMLRVVDPAAAVAARGFPLGVATELRILLDDRPMWLRVRDGRGSLEPAQPGAAPALHPRGLALLYAGTPSHVAHRAGLLERPLPELDAAFAGPAPGLLDYF